MRTTGDIWGSNILAGIAGSLAETICQMTIADMFFVHQRGTANGIYIVVVNMGAFLGPVAAGYSADSQGWRW
jgi:MFS family permease